MIGEAKTGAPSFRNLPVRLSIPALLEGFNCCKRVKTEACMTGSKEKFFQPDLAFHSTFQLYLFHIYLEDLVAFLINHLLDSNKSP